MFGFGVLDCPATKLKKTCRSKLNFSPAQLKWSAAVKLAWQTEYWGREQESGLSVLDCSLPPCKVNLTLDHAEEYKNNGQMCPCVAEAWWTFTN